MATVLHWVALFLCLQCQLLGRTAAFRPTVRQDASLRAEKTSSWLAYQHRTMPELVLSKGYPLEEHFVTTGDGYVLGVYRIPHGKINRCCNSGVINAAKEARVLTPGPASELHLHWCFAAFLVASGRQWCCSTVCWIAAQHGY